MGTALEDNTLLPLSHREGSPFANAVENNVSVGGPWVSQPTGVSCCSLGARSSPTSVHPGSFRSRLLEVRHLLTAKGTSENQARDSGTILYPGSIN